ncbi:MAG: damage-inducible protein DinB [Magnetospirillum sp.]|nr:damage-inducible protein DinB [Magnetospirillum sp.]
MREHFNLLGRYNQWANATLYGAIARLPPEEITRDRGGFFGSILGTLNHVLVTDRVWMARLKGEDYGWFTSLDQVLHTDFPTLRSMREEMDRTIITTVATQPLTGDLGFVNSKGLKQMVPRWIVLDHIFNHQTHHRGQAHDLLSQAGGAPPPLDLLYFPR